MNETSAIYQADAALQTILKAVVIEADSQDPASRLAGEDLNGLFTANGALSRPMIPKRCAF